MRTILGVIMAVLDGVSVLAQDKRAPCTRPTRKQTLAERNEALALAEVKRARKAAKRKGGV